MDVKRYFMRASKIIERIGDSKCDCDTPCQCVVYATDFDALLAQRDALQGKLKVAVEALEEIGGSNALHSSAANRVANEALAQIEGK